MNKLSRLLGTVWLLLSSSTVTIAAPFLFELPPPDVGEGRYAFTWSGVLEGFAEGSPYAKFNGEKFTLSGFYFSNGTFDFTRMEVLLPPPEQGGPGSLVALPSPAGGGPGNLFLPPPSEGGPTGIIRFEIAPPQLGGSPSARSLSLYFNDTAADFSNTTSSYQAAPVPEPSTILLFAAGLAGLTAIGRRRKA